ncbi:galactose oxidase [Saccharata proteae CBS 121410]|uniref:Galactose oxidase n=1 Tax=Saccharata proteae CBS 121410 TaxID=1314787 RepID=A0A9P4HV60_9PEZI|nr:galactose oxidase [Saccharata proteae CBS 121410]
MVEPAAAGALYAAEHFLEGAVAFAKGIIHPTLPLRATFTQITSAPLPRTCHTISVVKGRAYIFGGEGPDGQLVDNDMHVVILPSSGVLEADYTSIKARPGPEGGSVPSARKNHTAAIVGDSIFIYGGEVADPATEQPGGIVWVFSTTTNTWTSLSSSPPSDTTPVPSPRSHHTSAASEEPVPQTPKPTPVPLPQQPPDPAKHVPEPPAPESWGTIFIYGGMAADEEVLSDLWALDIRSRTWTPLPAPPGPGRHGASIAVEGSRLYLFGGTNDAKPIPGTMSYLDVSGLWKFAESGGRPGRTMSSVWEEVAVPEDRGPGARLGAPLLNVTTGQGRHYLLLVGGQRDPHALRETRLDDEGGDAPETKAEAAAAAAAFPISTPSSSGFLDDVWVYQLPSAAASAASAKDATRNTIKMDTRETHFAEVAYRYVDAAGDVVEERPAALSGSKGMGARAGFAAAKGTEVDGASVVVWGGRGVDGEVLGDGWLVTVDR